ncbi:hypothetical protein G5B88_19565 [Herbaspirillum seropedicae]|uniref:hypothetical protein n=1 Tax=Herbaspirillum seropedicae TaxID=964 RepID=UPI0002F31F17|nr:hypothetical protein [Herbaspirillum seropedicae]AKN67191.1 hypothetical protein ACP92_19285 [Herbaspirillum seropedicae]NQE30208.1 hypothetical protein [Herbaspirillum seropedicae]UMU23198.1 hypothetical protein G5B88_19565 [Herbaspirillum seropedicae]
MWSSHYPHSTHGVMAGFGPALCNSDFLRRYGKRLLRTARSGRNYEALPIVRRIVTMSVTPELSVSELFALRESLQLKHLLHTLAREIGFSCWEACVRQIDARPASLLDRYRFELGQFCDFQTNWFPDMEVAQHWQRQHGGYLIAFGRQVVAILH